MLPHHFTHPAEEGPGFDGRGNLSLPLWRVRSDLALATHRPFCSISSAWQVSEQTRPVFASRVRTASSVGSSTNNATFAARLNSRKASFALAPHTPSTPPASQPTRFNSVCRARTSLAFSSAPFAGLVVTGDCTPDGSAATLAVGGRAPSAS